MPFKVEAEAGFWKHTFTNLRTEFANLHIHAVIATCYVPFRQEMMRRKETGSESGMPEALRTLIFESLQNWANRIREYQAKTPMSPDITLKERQQLRADFRENILNVDTDIEKVSRDKQASHLDQILPPSAQRIQSVSFDYTGLNDLDFAQPTPDRVQHPILRGLVVGMDTLVVEMSRSHSADNETTIISEEAAFWVTAIADMYRFIDDYDPTKYPFWPTATSLNEKNGFNADGSADVLISEGDTPGERAGTTRRQQTA